MELGDWSQHFTLELYLMSFLKNCHPKLSREPLWHKNSDAFKFIPDTMSQPISRQW